MLKLSDFDYCLPKNLIAQEPIKPRDHSRLLVVQKRGVTNSAHPNINKKTGGEIKIEHRHFYDICDYFSKGDVIVMNNSKVFPARLIGKRKETGGKVEVFLLRRKEMLQRATFSGGDLGEVWRCLIGGGMRKEGLEIELGNGLRCRVLKNNNDGTFDVEFNKSGDGLMKIINKIGKMPLPPYIKRLDSRKKTADSRNYQTVYADCKKIGSVAAPTAGFHFTRALIRKLKKKGVRFEYITLHVGFGTFAPVKTDDVSKHKMHSEWVEVEKGVIKRIIKAKREKRRVIAVGTTSVRTLEAIWQEKSHSVALEPPSGFSDWVNIFIYQGYKFRVVDGMITNFHLPKSTLFMLVSAFAGKSTIDKAYRHAIKYKYRFYSYGDAMLIL